MTLRSVTFIFRMAAEHQRQLFVSLECSLGRLSQRVRGHSSPISSFHTAGFARIYSLNSDTHSCESRSITLTPSERSQSTPPWKFRLSPTITVLKPNWRTSPLQYQQGATVVTMMSLR